MAISSTVLRQVGITDDPDVITETLTEALTTILGQQHRADPATALTAGERGALERGGMDLVQREWGRDDPLLRTAAEYAVLVASAYSVEQVARILHVAPSRVRQRLGARTIYGFKEHGKWRLPRVQFEDGRLVPNADVVFPRLRDGLHPVGVWRWLTTANPDLIIGDEETPVSPLEWLRAGLDSRPVADLASEL